MPGRKPVDPIIERKMMAEDLESKLDEASSLASSIASALDDGANPPELRDAWNSIAGELTGILTRAKKLAR